MHSILRARVLEAQGDRAGAIEAYRDVLEPLSRWGYLGAQQIPAHYELGRLLEAEGSLAAARKHYRAYVDAWGDADMLVPNVEAAKARLQALGVPQ